MEADGESQPRIPRAKVEEFLQLRNRSAASLLAGFHALEDTNLLNEAATRFPNDPQVQWTMLAQDLNPEERRKWLDLFKQSSPANSLANYLSAANLFNHGQSDAALKELIEASGKKQYKGYAMEAMMDEQELSRFAGQTPLETILVSAWSDELLSELAPLKVVANGIAEAQAQHVQAGDVESANNLIQTGLGLANRLGEGEGGRFLVNQLVGIAIEGIMLKQLQPDTRYDSLGGKTPAERRAELTQQNAAVRELRKTVPSAVGKPSEVEWLSYSDRMKAYGEMEAMKWLQQRLASAAPGGK